MSESARSSRRALIAAVLMTAGFLVVLPMGAPAQSAKPGRTVEGRWEATARMGTTEVRFILNLRKNADGTFGGTYRGIEQGPDWPLETPLLMKGTVMVDGDRVRFYPGAISGVFEGALGSSGVEITGKWTQAGIAEEGGQTKARGPEPMVFTRVPANRKKLAPENPGSSAKN